VPKGKGKTCIKLIFYIKLPHSVPKGKGKLSLKRALDKKHSLDKKNALIKTCIG
jgi:hypothetical protein